MLDLKQNKAFDEKVCLKERLGSSKFKGKDN